MKDVTFIGDELETKKSLKKLRHEILSHFCDMQNYLQHGGNTKY